MEEKKLNIVMISTLDTRGGAGKMAVSLAEELIRRGHTVDMFVGWKHSTLPFVHEMPKSPFYYRLSRWFATDLRFSKSDWLLNQCAYKNADIIHAHNIHSGFFNWSTFKKIVDEKPTVWTLHDLWAITGRETTEFSLKENKPWRFFNIFGDNRKNILNQKEKLYTNSFFHTVVPSQWLKEKVQKSALGKLPCSVIHNPVDTSIFTLQDKQEAREKLNLPADKKIIAYIMPKSMTDKRKGPEYIKAIIEKYKNDDTVLFLNIGTSSIDPTNTRITTTGYIEDPNILARYYAAADVLLYPSLADSFGLVVAEAMACGTPAAVFRTDGVPEIVVDERYGYIAEQGNVDDLAHGLTKILEQSPEASREMSRLCAERVREAFSLQTIADAYEHAYRKALEDKRD